MVENLKLFQGRSYLGGVAEAMTRLVKVKNSKVKQEIAEQLGFMADNIIYDLAYAKIFCR